MAMLELNRDLYYDTGISIDNLVESQEPYLLIFPQLNSESKFKTNGDFCYEKFSTFIIDFYSYFVEPQNFKQEEIPIKTNQYGNEEYIINREDEIRGSSERLVELFDRIDYTPTKPKNELIEFVQTANNQGYLPNSITQNLLGAINIYTNTIPKHTKPYELKLIVNNEQRKKSKLKRLLDFLKGLY
jgi:hypothetical protein